MKQQIKILILDDCTDLLDALKIFLEMKSFNVKGVISAELFATELITFMPDLIILDVYIKQSDGRDICNKIKGDKETRHIPVILMSADILALKNNMEYSPDAFLDKPFNLSVLLEKIKILTDNKLIKFTPPHQEKFINSKLKQNYA